MRIRLVSGSGSVVVEGDRIAVDDRPCDVVVDLGPGELRPGLINAHDHLHRNHYPRLGTPPYQDAYAWGEAIHAGWADEIARGRAVPRWDALLFGALKNLLGGVTTVVHHDRWEPAFDEGFPVRLARVRTVHSIGLEPGLEGAGDAESSRPLCIHLAEGTTHAMADEVRQLDQRGLLDRRLLAVHGVGVDADGIRRLRSAGAALVWCPSSNLFLYGRTAPEGLLRSGLDVLLGSDSLLSGDGTLLAELRLARRLKLLDDRALLEAVGARAAARLGLPVPELVSGSPADLVYLRRPLLEATPEDVDLVLVGGVPRLASGAFEGLFTTMGVTAESLEVGRTAKLVAAPLATVAARIVAGWPEAARVFSAAG